MINDKKLPLKEKYLEYFRDLPVKKLAADHIGRSVDAVAIWLKEDVDFSEQVNQAKADWAKRTTKQVRSKEWLLERVLREEFAPNDQNVNHNIKVEINDYGSDSKNNPPTETEGSTNN